MKKKINKNVLKILKIIPLSKKVGKKNRIKKMKTIEEINLVIIIKRRAEAILEVIEIDHTEIMKIIVRRKMERKKEKKEIIYLSMIITFKIL